MLHEVLLALSGHPSPIFEDHHPQEFPLVTAAESSLLTSLGRLATLHRALKSHLPRIIAYHPSLICRAVANSIISVHLAHFQSLILDTEQRILSKDSAVVGAYEIVPLAGILNTFEPWKRTLEWYWELACFMYSAEAAPLSDAAAPSKSVACTGAAILNKLRMECRTGYSTIEESALELVAVAEQVWIKHFSNWLLTAISTSKTADWDFFISKDDYAGLSASHPQLRMSTDLVPNFVTHDATISMLFIGRTLQILRSNRARTSHSKTSTLSSLNVNVKGAFLVPQNFFRELSKLDSPIRPAVFSRLISNLRDEITATLVNEVLPAQHFMKTLSRLQQFLLGSRADFMDILITEADNHIALRHSQSARGNESSIASSFVGIVMKEAEVGVVLSKAWSNLAPCITKGVVEEEDVEWAQEHLSLRMVSSDENNYDEFDDFLLYTPTALLPRLDAGFDLLIGGDDAAMYSKLHSYLLAIRRGHNHLADLWRQTWCRRDHPAPARRGRTSKSFSVMKGKRHTTDQRMKALRGTWCTCNAIICTLAALGDYLVEEVAKGSWHAFESWAILGDTKRSESLAQNLSTQSLDMAEKQTLPHDPETIAQGHRQYLMALVDSMLLSDLEYTALLKSILRGVDQMAGTMKRLGEAQRSIDLYDEGVVEEGAREIHQADEEKTLEQVAIVRNKLDHDLERLKEHLRGLSREPISRTKVRNVSIRFEAFTIGSGLDRLLTRLENGVVSESEHQH